MVIFHARHTLRHSLSFFCLLAIYRVLKPTSQAPHKPSNYKTFLPFPSHEDELQLLALQFHYGLRTERRACLLPVWPHVLTALSDTMFRTSLARAYIYEGLC